MSFANFFNDTRVADICGFSGTFQNAANALNTPLPSQLVNGVITDNNAVRAQSVRLPQLVDMQAYFESLNIPFVPGLRFTYTISCQNAGSILTLVQSTDTFFTVNSVAAVPQGSRTFVCVVQNPPTTIKAY
jgi:hypothetical protein